VFGGALHVGRGGGSGDVIFQFLSIFWLLKKGQKIEALGEEEFG